MRLLASAPISSKQPQTVRRSCSTCLTTHVVFTVPDKVAVIAFQNQTVVYDILFRAASETLRTIAADPKHLGAEIGFLAVLHTWGQNLLHRPHLLWLLPGGGIAPDGGNWIPCRPRFFPIGQGFVADVSGVVSAQPEEGLRR